MPIIHPWGLALGLGMCLFSGCVHAPAAYGAERVAADKGATSVSAVPEALQAAVLDDVGKRSGVPRERITLVVAERVTWSDSSIGCPEPGMLYTQSLVPGYRIVAMVKGQHYEYHASTRGEPRFCPPERVTAPVPDDRV